jgi:hypothetical protein
MYEKVAKEVIFKIKLMGWMDSEDDIISDKQEKTRCLKCRFSMIGFQKKCEYCGSEQVDPFVVHYKKVILQKRVDLEAYQQELLLKKDNQPIVELLKLELQNEELLFKKMQIRRGLDAKNP